MVFDNVTREATRRAFLNDDCHGGIDETCPQVDEACNLFDENIETGNMRSKLASLEHELIGLSDSREDAFNQMELCGDALNAMDSQIDEIREAAAHIEAALDDLTPAVGGHVVAEVIKEQVTYPFREALVQAHTMVVQLENQIASDREEHGRQMRASSLKVRRMRFVFKMMAASS